MNFTARDGYDVPVRSTCLVCMKSGFSWSSILTGAEIRWPQGRVGAGSQSCPVEEEKDGVEESDHS